ncbi:MAG: D-Ala-D-Ala carboxypeptidase family metallohydrolase [Bacteroidales bacterium]|nr:D-Ala-D-Ala carboxypeptidase family metallohydrolase [Bacteroidales bacterium]
MKYFTYEEFEKSSTAQAHHVDNTIPPAYKLNIAKLVSFILDPAREAYGMPIIVTSGYRCEKLNRLTKGAAPKSLHTRGWAADIRCRTGDDNETLLEILKMLPCYELIPYRDRVTGKIKRFHVSYQEGKKKDGGWFSKYE